jgi:hypothetical protein
MDDHKLSHAVHTRNTLKQRIVAQRELEENDPDLETILEDATDLNAMCVAIALSIREDEAFAEGMDALIEDMKRRKSRYERRASYKRKQIAWAMQETGLTAIKSAGVTLSLRKGREKMLIDETILTDDYRKSKVTMVIDRDAIEAAIEAGNLPAGVTMANPEPVLSLLAK